MKNCVLVIQGWKLIILTRHTKLVKSEIKTLKTIYLLCITWNQFCCSFLWWIIINTGYGVCHLKKSSFFKFGVGKIINFQNIKESANLVHYHSIKLLLICTQIEYSHHIAPLSFLSLFSLIMFYINLYMLVWQHLNG